MDLAADQIIAQLDLTSLQPQLQGLARDRSELNLATAKASRATKAVGFLDRINVFTKSEAELERDATTAARGTLEESVTAKEAQVRNAIWDALPGGIKLRCLIGDLQRTHHALRRQVDVVRTSFEEYTKEVDRNAAEMDEYIRNVESVAGEIRRPGAARRRKANPGDVETGLAGSVTAIDDADRGLRSLRALLAEETGSPMTGLSLDDLLEAALTRVARPS